MKRKVTVLSALALVSSQVSGAGMAISQEAELLVAACGNIEAIEDRAELQELLGILLESDPNNLCIDLIVERLGGGPVALVDPPDPY